MTTNHPFNSEVEASEYEEWLDFVQADAEGRDEYRAACNEIE